MARKNKSNQLSREYLLKAYVTLMQDVPYSSISITDITSAAGVSRMAYYRNYTAKEEILTQYLDEVSETIVHPLNDYLPVPKNTTEYMVLLFKRLVTDATTYGYNLGLGLSKAGLGDLLLENVTKNLLSFFPPKDQREAATVALSAGAFYGLFMQWSRDGQEGDTEMLSDMLAEFLTERPPFI